MAALGDSLGHANYRSGETMNLQTMTATTVLLVVLTSIFCSHSALAQEDKLYVIASGSKSEVKVLEPALRYFRSEVTENSDLQFSADEEMDSVMSSCRETIGVSPTEERDCRLQAARRVMVEQVLEVVATPSGKRWEIWLRAMDSEGVLLFEDYVEPEETQLSDAAKLALPLLAHKYLCTARQVASSCETQGGGTTTSGAVVNAGVTVDRGEKIVNEIVDDTAFLTVKSVPSGAAVSVNGAAVGVTPYQDELMLGRYVVVVESGALYYPAREELNLTSAGAKVNVDLEPRFGTLNVTSTPNGAEVYVDGELAGTTPLKQEKKPSGSYGARVALASYLDETRTVAVEDGKTAKLAVELVHNVGELYVTSEPAGAAVTLNDTSMDAVTPATFTGLQPGTYKLVLSKAGYGDAVEKAKVARGERATVAATLEARLGLVSVLASYDDGTPCEGAVFIDGTKEGDTPLKVTLSAAQHTVLVECELGSGETTVEVEHNGKQKVEVVVSTGPKTAGYVLVEKGKFEMGSPTSEEGRYDAETQHTVTLTRSFYLKATEVTQGEWRALMGNNPSSFSSCGDDCPVEQVSWYDALAYSNALSRLEGSKECYDLSGCSGTPGKKGYSCPDDLSFKLSCEGYRLPTEAEWEYAARAGTGTRFSSGDAESDLGKAGWYEGNSGSKTHAVGQKAANAWGLYDMHGNVWEWTWDWYGDYPSKATDPVGGKTGSGRVLRGGGWGSGARGCRAAIRGYYSPSYRGGLLGFRPVRSSP